MAGLRHLEPRLRDLLRRRESVQQQIIGDGVLPDFPADTAAVREVDWAVAAPPDEIADRRVEITGPVDRKMMIHALNSGARVFMADFEDSLSPTWTNVVEGQANLRDAVRRSITFVSPEGKTYRLEERTAVLFVRPRGWHLDERHVLVDGQPVSASLFDAGLYLFHNARELLTRGTRPYLYLPKLESHLEARLWNEVFLLVQDALGIPRGTIRATVLIENVLAAFEMDEILWELQEHSAGLNCGRWDYIFSFIKKFRHRADFVLPDRDQVGMDRRFLKSYVDLLIRTCHRRGAHAMGGMAAQIPIKTDPEANGRALAKVREDKVREVEAGHDGTWVAHPGLVPVAKEVFDQHMPTPNQYDKQRPDVNVTAADLLDFRPEAPITEGGLRNNISVGIQYIGAWLAGNGCVPVYNLMEDAATAEISRSQIWQWIRSPKGQLDDGRKVTVDLFRKLLGEELAKVKASDAPGQLDEAAALFERMIADDHYVEFLTLPAYALID